MDTYCNRRETPLASDDDVSDWEGWRPLAEAPRPAESVAVASNGDGRLEVFVTDPEAGTFHARQTSRNSAAWSDWNRRGDQMGDEILVKRRRDERLHVFFLRYADQTGSTKAERELTARVHHFWQLDRDGEAWGDWHRRGRVAGHSLAVGNNEDGRFEAFLVREDDMPVHLRQTGYEDADWDETWDELSHKEDFEVFHRPKAKSMAVGRDATGRLSVFITGRRLHRLTQTSPNGDWPLWEKFGNVRCFSLDVARTTDGRLVVFGIEDATKGDPKMHQRWEKTTGRWSKWWTRKI